MIPLYNKPKLTGDAGFELLDDMQLGSTDFKNKLTKQRISKAKLQEQSKKSKVLNTQKYNLQNLNALFLKTMMKSLLHQLCWYSKQAIDLRVHK